MQRIKTIFAVLTLFFSIASLKAQTPDSVRRQEIAVPRQEMTVPQQESPSRPTETDVRQELEKQPEMRADDRQWQELDALQRDIDERQRKVDSLRKQLEDSLKRAAFLRDSLYLDSLASLPLYLAKEDIPATIYYGYDWNTVNTRSTYCFDQTRTYMLPLDSAHFVMPAKDGKVISPYGYRSGRMHTGTDYKQRLGDSICSAWDGVVRMAKMGYYGYGGIVVVRHANGLETFYAHLSKIKVRVNQKVKAGDLVGLAGRTGRASTEHLHLETRFLYQSLNPALLIDFETGRLVTDTLVVDKGKFYAVESYRAKKSAPVLSIPITEDTMATFDSLPVIDSSLARVNGAASSPSTQSGDSSNSQKVTPASSSQGVSSPSRNVSVKQPAAAKKPAYHVVKSGDTLYAIAKKYHTTVAKLCEINHIKETGILSLGQKIKLP